MSQKALKIENVFIYKLSKIFNHPGYLTFLSDLFDRFGFFKLFYQALIKISIRAAIIN